MSVFIGKNPPAAFANCLSAVTTIASSSPLGGGRKAGCDYFFPTKSAPEYSRAAGIPGEVRGATERVWGREDPWGAAAP